MTKSQNTKNEQLTEQWKKGELPRGYYYMQTIFSPRVYIQRCIINYKKTEFEDYDNVQAVLAPVPSYDEWIGVKQQRDLENKLRHDSDNRNWQLRTKNKQLKELLKECKNILEEQTFCRNTSLETDETLRNRIVKKAEILQEIDEALR